MKAVTPRKIRFSIVSATATTIDFGILLLTTTVFGVGLIQSNYISASCGFIYSFIANKKFTFKTNGDRIQKEIFLYIAITLIGIWVIQPLIIWPAEHLLELTELRGWIVAVIAKIIASIVTFFWNYYGYTRIVFKKPQPVDTILPK